MKRLWIALGLVAGGALLWHFWAKGEMKFLPSVKTDGAKPQLWFGLDVAAGLLKALGGPELTVTSMNDGRHSKQTLHDDGLAADLRIRDIPVAILKRFFDLLKAILAPFGFDAVLESDHIHIEYDPKGGRNLF